MVVKLPNMQTNKLRCQCATPSVSGTAGTGAALALAEEGAEVMFRIVRVGRRIAATDALPLGEAGHRQCRAKAAQSRAT